jgi:hypothetical protein
MFHNLMVNSGQSFSSGNLNVDAAGRVRVKYKNSDVLLRKSAPAPALVFDHPSAFSSAPAPENSLKFDTRAPD